MDARRSENGTRVNLVGTPVYTADEEALGVVAAVVGRDVVVRGTSPARSVYVLPVSAVARRDNATLHIDRPLEEVIQRVRDAWNPGNERGIR